jgi:hypothetical protein
MMYTACAIRWTADKIISWKTNPKRVPCTNQAHLCKRRRFYVIWNIRFCQFFSIFNNNQVVLRILNYWRLINDCYWYWLRFRIACMNSRAFCKFKIECASPCWCCETWRLKLQFIGCRCFVIVNESSNTTKGAYWSTVIMICPRSIWRVMRMCINIGFGLSYC